MSFIIKEGRCVIVDAKSQKKNDRKLTVSSKKDSLESESMPKVNKRRVMSAKDWTGIGEKLFGEDRKKWQFVCPNCGNIQSLKDFENIGMKTEEAVKYVYFSCIGRFIENAKGNLGNKLKPCNYTNGGFFNLAKLTVVNPDGDESPVFDFARDNHAK